VEERVRRRKSEVCILTKVNHRQKWKSAIFTYFCGTGSYVTWHQNKTLSLELFTGKIAQLEAAK
jgi:hypothetical protein